MREKISWKNINFCRNYIEKTDGPKFADPSMAAVSPSFKRSMLQANKRRAAWKMIVWELNVRVVEMNVQWTDVKWTDEKKLG